MKARRTRRTRTRTRLSTTEYEKGVKMKGILANSCFFFFSSSPSGLSWCVYVVAQLNCPGKQDSQCSLRKRIPGA